MADDLTIEVTGSAEKAASALDKIIQKITDLQERFDKAAPSVSKFASQMEQIASSSKAFQAFQKMAGGLDKQALSAKNAESKMAMYQARLDRANASMAQSAVTSAKARAAQDSATVSQFKAEASLEKIIADTEKYKAAQDSATVAGWKNEAALEKVAAATQKASEAQKMAANNSAAFSMSPADFAAKYNHSSNGGADLTPQTSEGTEAGPAPVNVPVEKFDVSKIQANIDSMKPKISIDADSAMAELQRMGEYIDGLRPRISGMSEEAQAQFNALAAKLELVSRQIDNQRNAYRGLQSAALKAEQEQGNGSDAYLKLEKRILSADAASQRLSETQEKLKAELAGVASATGKVGTGMTDAGNKSERVAKKSTSAWSNTMRMFEKMMIRIAAFRVFSAFSQGITTGMQNMAQASSAANAAMSSLATSSLYLKNSFATALMPAIQALTPAITWLIDKIASLFNMIGMLTARIFGGSSTVTVAKVAQVNYAATLDKTGDSAKKAEKKVKELQRTVMGFDELNVLTKPTSPAASAPAKSSGKPGMPSVGSMFQTVKIPAGIQALGDKVRKFFSEWAKYAEPARAALEKLWQRLAPFKTFVAKGVEDFYNDFLKPLGIWALGTAFPTFCNIVGNLANDIDWKSLNKALDELWKGLEPFAEVIGNGLLWFLDKVLEPLAAWCMNNIVTPTISLIGKALKGLSDWAKTHGTEFHGIILGIAAAFATWETIKGISALRKGISGVNTDLLLMKVRYALLFASIAVVVAVIYTLVTSWDKLTVAQKVAYIAIGALAAVIGVVTAAQLLFNVSLLACPATWIILAILAIVATIAILWQKNAGFRDFILGVWKGLQDAGGKVGHWFQNDFVGFFKNAWKWIQDVWKGAGSWFGGIWKGIQGVFGNVGGWFKGVFSGAWSNIKSAWSGVPGWFSGLWNKILGFFRPTLITDGFKRAWKSLTSWHIPAPHISWVGGGWQSSGWIYNVLNALHLPTQMPKLNIDWYAKGGLFTAPSLVGVGEAGPEAALPLNDKVFSQIAQGIVKNGNSSGNGLDTDRIIDQMDKMEKAIENMKLYLYSDDRKIAESANRGNRAIARRNPVAT